MTLLQLSLNQQITASGQQSARQTFITSQFSLYQEVFCHIFNLEHSADFCVTSIWGSGKETTIKHIPLYVVLNNCQSMCQNVKKL